MSLQIRRGPNTGVGGRTGVTLVPGEIAFVTDYATASVSPMWIGDGVTLGGIPVSPVLSINGLTGNISLTSDTVGEGNLNKYFTSTRASDAVGAMLAAGTLSGITINYNSTTHAITISSTNVIQTGTANSIAYWAANGTTLSPSQSLTWSEISNNLNVINGNFSLQNNYSGAQNQTFTTYSSDNLSNNAVYRKARGTNISPSPILAGDNVQNLNFQAFMGGTFSNVANMVVNVTALNGSIMAGEIKFLTSEYLTGNLTPRVTITDRDSTTPTLNIGPTVTTEGGSGSLRIIQNSVSSNTLSPFIIANYNSDAYGTQISFRKFRGSFASPTAVLTNDVLMQLNTRGSDGVNLNGTPSTQIQMIVDGTVSTGVVPGAILFKTASSTGVMTQALKIDQTQVSTFSNNVVVNGNLTVNGSTVTANTTTINVEDKLMKLGYLPSTQVSTTGTVGTVKGVLLQGSTTFTSSGVSIVSAATYTSVIQTATSGSGASAVFTVQKTGTAPNYCSSVTLATGTVGSIKGALLQGSTTFSATGTSVTAASTYTGVSQTATSGTGAGAVFTIQKVGVGTAYNGALTITITTPGTGYAIGDTITIPGASLGGATPANNLVLTVASVITSPWTATVSGLSGVAGLVIGGTINAAAGTGFLYGGSPSSCVITTIGSTSITYTVTGGTTPVAGNITSLVQSSNVTVTITSPGTGYAIGDTVTLPGASLGGATPANNLVLTVNTALGSPWTATITGMTDNVGLQVGSAITATNGVGSLGGSGAYLISTLPTATSVTYTATGGTTPVAGTITNITTNGATDYTANGGGIQVYGATNKTFTWASTNTAWASSESIALSGGKSLIINGSISGAVSFVATGAVGTQNYVLPTALPASSGYALASDTSGNLSWIAVNSSTISGAQLTNGATVSGGSLTFSGNISAAAWTTSGIRHVSVPATLTDTTSTGVVTNAYTNNFGGNTIAATGTVTYTNYATVFVNDPTSGTNVTITNPYSLITAGNVKLGTTGTGTIAAVAAQATTASTAASVGYQGMPQNTQSSAYPVAIGDAGKHIYASATMTATIPANGSVPFPIGTTIAFIAGAGATLTIAITTDKLYLGGAGTGGAGVSRTLAAYGMATAVKVASDTWFINGTGLT